MARRAPVAFRSRARVGRVRSGLEELLARPGGLRGVRVAGVATAGAVGDRLSPLPGLSCRPSLVKHALRSPTSRC